MTEILIQDSNSISQSHMHLDTQNGVKHQSGPHPRYHGHHDDRLKMIALYHHGQVQPALAVKEESIKGK